MNYEQCNCPDQFKHNPIARYVKGHNPRFDPLGIQHEDGHSSLIAILIHDCSKQRCDFLQDLLLAHNTIL